MLVLIQLLLALSEILDKFKEKMDIFALRICIEIKK